VWPGFHPGPVHGRIMVHILVLGQRLRSYPVSVITSVLYILLSPNTTLIRRISERERNWGTLEQGNALSEMGELWTGNCLRIGLELKELRYALLLT